MSEVQSTPEKVRRRRGQGSVKEYRPGKWQVRFPGRKGMTKAGFDSKEQALAWLEYRMGRSRPTAAPAAIAAISSLLAPPAVPVALGPGIYFLCDGPDVVYVGQSTEVYIRVPQHVTTKVFDRWYWMPALEVELNHIEGAFIRLLRPKYNYGGDGRLRGPMPGNISHLFNWFPGTKPGPGESSAPCSHL